MTLPNSAWAMIAALIVVSLAGCLSLDEIAPQQAPSDPEAASHATSDPDATHAAPTPANDTTTEQTENDLTDDQEQDEDKQPSVDSPVAKLEITDQEGNATGKAPFTVQFNLSADYQDMSRLHWVFDAGDGTTATNGTGNELPLQLNHTYTEAGNHTATFTVENDTTNDTVNRTIQVETAQVTTTGIGVTLIVHTQFAGLAGQDPGSPSDLPGTAQCELDIASGADGGDVLDEGVAAGCIAEWSHDSFDGARFVVSIDNLRAEGLTCLAWPVVCQFWELRVNGESSEVGIDDYSVKAGDTIEFFHTTLGE